MPRSPYAVDVALPDDLVILFVEIATEPVPVRSTLVTLLVDGSAAVSTAITFLQGPPAIGYFVDRVRNWLHRKRDEGVVELTIKGRGVDAKFQITEDTDLTELATTLHRVLFPPRVTRLRTDRSDIGI
jgi:hypothetical protein